MEKKVYLETDEFGSKIVVEETAENGNKTFHSYYADNLISLLYQTVNKLDKIDKRVNEMDQMLENLQVQADTVKNPKESEKVFHMQTCIRDLALCAENADNIARTCRAWIDELVRLRKVNSHGTV